MREISILILIWVITRIPLLTPMPLTMVAIVEAASETLDRLHYGTWWWTDTLGAVANTLSWPLVLFIGLRLAGHGRPERPFNRATEMGDKAV